MSFRTIQQKIAALSQFNGAAPAAAAVQGNDMEAHPAGTVGGLFNFGNSDPVQVKQIFIKFGGQSSWSLALVDVDAVETTLLSGTNETFLANLTLGLILLQGQKLKLVTSGATTAMTARITVDTKP